eukprot:Skav230452  [mRNA]  locus=scaffold2124:56596:57010:- [translate_table: standard]
MESSKTFTLKSSSIEKDNFFLEPKELPVGYKTVKFFSQEPSSAVTCTAYSCALMSEKKIFFTLKELLELAATSAAPMAAASSPFKCCPRGRLAMLHQLPQQTSHLPWSHLHWTMLFQWV